MKEDPREAIAARRRAWIAAVEDGDLDRYGELFRPDVVWIPPGADALVGRAAVRAWLAPFLEAWAYELDLEPEAVRPAGAWAVERGSFRSRMAPRGGGDPMEHEGRYLVLWRFDDEWRIDRYVDLS